MPPTATETFLNSALERDQVRQQGPSLHTFVVSWSGKHANAERIAKAVASSSDFVTVVYSDPDSGFAPAFPGESIRRPDDLFYGDKFHACLTHCRSDVLLLIHADCDCDNWAGIPESCRRGVVQIANLGVWVPFIDHTDWSLDRVEIDRIPDSPFSIVAQTDSIVFGLTRPIIDRLRKASFEGNVYGWGIEFMYNFYTYSIGRICVVDRSVPVRHPRGTAYSIEPAIIQAKEFLKQLTPAERVQSCLLDAIVRLRDRIRENG